MNYLRDKDSIFTSRRNLNKNKTKFLFISAIVVFFVYIFLFTNIFSVLESNVGSVARPIWKFQDHVISVSDNIYSLIASKKTLLEKNKRLEEQLKLSLIKSLDRDILFEENIELKELLGRSATSNMVFATVIAKPNRTLYDTLIIDVGNDAGIQKGDTVLYGGSIAIGKIVEVFNRSAKVLLFSSSGEKLDVLVGLENITAIAHGRGGGSFEVELPRDASINIGDIALVPNITPRMLGTVEYINKSPSDPFKTILLSGPVDIFKLKWVEVVLQKE